MNATKHFACILAAGWLTGVIYEVAFIKSSTKMAAKRLQEGCDACEETLRLRRANERIKLLLLLQEAIK